jgi:hypothetical protein
MKKTAIFLASITLFVSAVSLASAEQDSATALKALESAFFTHIGKSEFEAAAALFHYPPTYTPKERSHDAAAVSRMLEFFAEEFGSPKSPRASESPAQYWSVAAMGGNIPYWQANPVLLQSRYDVAFTKEGYGYVMFQFCKLNSQWEIRAVAYALPAQRPDSKARVMEIGEKLIQIMKPFMEESETGNKANKT